MSALETLGVFSPFHFDHRIHGEKGVLVLNLMGSLFARRNKLRRQATLFGVLALVFFPGLMLIGDHGDCLQLQAYAFRPLVQSRKQTSRPTSRCWGSTDKENIRETRRRPRAGGDQRKPLFSRVLNPAPRLPRAGV